MQRRWNLPLILASLAALAAGGSGAVGSGARRVSGHVPLKRIQSSRHLGRHASLERVPLAVSLIPRDAVGLADLIAGLHDPSDPRFGQYLTPDEFRARYAPTDADVAAVTDFLRSRGLTVKDVAANHLLVTAEGTSAEVENAFQLELHDYATADGRVAFAPNGEPLVLGDAAEKVLAVNGLSSFSVRRAHRHQLKRIDPAELSPRAAKTVNDYMTPAKIRKAYGVDQVTQTGTGETLALFELDGYNAGDISKFATQFNLTVPTLQNVLVSDGTSAPSGAAGADTDEVALDIEVAMAMAPGLGKIMVYEGKNTDAGVLATYAKIASDNLAKEVSTSWGEPEDGPSSSYLNSENTIFQQMAAQGQSIFAASGDSGAYDDISNRPNTLLVDDPASQPYVTAVGGTTLTADGVTGAYMSETSWGDATTNPHSGGGGGISKIWNLPSWQANLATAANKGSATKRMVPDVSLDSNPNTGYPVYVTVPGSAGGFYAIGGTSAAAPLWAAFMAIVNQGRVAGGVARIGFANTTIYKFGNSSLYGNLFHDIKDNSTNLFYPAVTGYDLTTGWGTINGPGLYKALASGVDPATAPTSLNLASSSAKLTLLWAGATNATSYNVYRSSTGVTGSYTALATNVKTTSYDDTTNGGTVYFYYVTSVNAAGETGPSPVQSGAAGQAAPSAPTGLTGTVVP